MYLVSLLEYSIFLSLFLSLAFPPPTPCPLSPAHSDVIVSCPIDVDARLKAVCTDPQLNINCSAEFHLQKVTDAYKSHVISIQTKVCRLLLSTFSNNIHNGVFPHCDIGIFPEIKHKVKIPSSTACFTNISETLKRNSFSSKHKIIYYSDLFFFFAIFLFLHFST